MKTPYKPCFWDLTSGSVVDPPCKASKLGPFSGLFPSIDRVATKELALLVQTLC